MIHRSDSRALFDAEVTDDYLREWTDRVASRKVAAKTGLKTVVVFSIGPEWLALPTGVFQEVVDHCVVRTLPHRRGGVLSGLANVRGELLICVSLSVLLGLETAAQASAEQRASRGRLLICNRKGDRLAFRADVVHGVVRYHPEDLREVPATLARASAKMYVAGILPWHDRTVGCLDDELLFYALNKGMA